MGQHVTPIGGQTKYDYLETKDLAVTRDASIQNDLDANHVTANDIITSDISTQTAEVSESLNVVGDITTNGDLTVNGTANMGAINGGYIPIVLPLGRSLTVTDSSSASARVLFEENLACRFSGTITYKVIPTGSFTSNLILTHVDGTETNIELTKGSTMHTYTIEEDNVVKVTWRYSATGTYRFNGEVHY